MDWTMEEYSSHLNLFMMSNLNTILFPCVSLFSTCNDTISLFAFSIMSNNLTVVLNNAADEKCFDYNCCPNAFIFMEDLPEKLPYHWRRILIISKTQKLPKAKLFGWKDVSIITNTTILRLSTRVDQKRHFINFEDEELKNDKLDFMGRKLKVLAFDCPPLMTLKFAENGYEFKILKEMSKKLNFTWKFNILTGEQYGIDVDDRWVGGVRGILGENLADIGICGNWIFAKSLAAIDVTVGNIQHQIRLFVPKASRVDRWYSLITPFTPSLWIAIFLTMLFITFIYQYFLSINGISMDVYWAFFEMYSIFFGNYSIHSKSKKIALITITFSIFSILITNIFSSEIVSRLTNIVYNKEIDTVQDLVENDFLWGKMNEITDMGIILSLEKKSHKEIVHKFKLLKSESDCLKKVQTNKFALYGDLVGIDDFSNAITFCKLTFDIWKNLRIMKEVLKKYDSGIAFQKYSPLTQPTSRLHSGGLLGKMYKDSLHGYRKKTILEEKNRREISEPKPLSLNNIQGAFYALLIGLLTSLIVFIIELISIHKK